MIIFCIITGGCSCNGSDLIEVSNWP